MPIILNGTTGINTDGTLVATGSLTTSSTLTTGTGAIYNGIQSGTVVSPMNTTNVTFTGIPSWVKRITLLVNEASAAISFRLGTSGGIVSTGIYAYTAGGVLNSNQTSNANTTTATFFDTADNSSGVFVFHNITGNTWTYSGTAGGPGSGRRSGVLSGYVTLPSGPLTQVQIVGTFTSGVANILYE
jgi:hypothetical protein